MEKVRGRDKKKFASEMLESDVEVIIFGSLVRAEHVIGLSDIDVMIVSQKFENPKIKYELLAELLTRFGDPFEFHLATPKENIHELHKKRIHKNLKHSALFKPHILNKTKLSL